MRRVLAVALAGVLAALVATVLMPTTATATSPARLLAASLVARQVGHHGLRGPAPDRAMVLGAWRDAGVDIRDLATPSALLHACTMLAHGQPRPAGPAPADYVLYRDTGGADHIGMLLSPVDIAVVDAGSVEAVPLPQLDAPGDAPIPRLLAEASSVHICRLAPSRWPGGRDDTSVGVGRIALADPEQVAEHMRWTADHPRNADTGVLATIGRIAATFAVGVSGTVTELISGLFSGMHAVLEWLGPAGAPLLLLGELFGRTFDGRRLHAVLTGIVLAALGVALGLGWLLPFGWVVVGAVLGGGAASAAGVPVLGAIGGALVGAGFAVSSFLVGVLTGVDDSDRVCVGTVLFSLVADVLWLRPMLAALGAAMHLPGTRSVAGLLARAERLWPLGRVAGDGRSLLDVYSTAGDALALRPHAVAQTARALMSGRLAAPDAATVAARTMAAAPPVHRALSAAEAMGAVGRRGVDMVSLTWRPSSIASDMVGHAADALHYLDTELRTGLPSMPGVRQALLTMPPERRAALLAVMQHGSTHLVPQMQITARLSHLHSGARTLTGIAIGQSQHPSWWRAWRSPVVHRLLRGLPGREPAM
jgi:hypothetical protein